MYTTDADPMLAVTRFCFTSIGAARKSSFRLLHSYAFIAALPVIRLRELAQQEVNANIVCYTSKKGTCTTIAAVNINYS